MRRLREHNVRHLFGVPGVTCDGAFGAAQRAGLTTIVTASDLEAGYAADGYARIRGLSAVTVTYGVGTMSLLPVIAGAYAERVPIVLLNGGPNATDLAGQANLDVLFSHSTGRMDADLKVFEPVTAAAIRIARAQDAPALIDEALLRARLEQRPVYVEVHRDLWGATITPPTVALTVPPAADQNEAKLARDLLARIRSGGKPMLMLGIEFSRQGLTTEIEEVVRSLGVPYVTTLLSKGVIPETTPGFAGVFGSRYAPPAIRTAVEQSDPIISLGDVFGAQHREFVSASRARFVRVAAGGVRFGSGQRQPANLRRLIAALKSELAAQTWRADPAWRTRAALPGLSFDDRRRSITERQPAAPQGGMTYDDALRVVSDFLNDDFITITDTSLSMYPAADLNLKGKGSFVANSVWQSIGFSVAAAVGIGVAQERRPLVLSGDGGFQMTAQALSTLVRQRTRAIVLVFDNALYGIEQFLLQRSFFSNTAAPAPHLTLNRWNYVALATALGCTSTALATTASELSAALQSASSADGPALITVRIAPKDLPDGLPSS